MHITSQAARDLAESTRGVAGEALSSLQCVKFNGGIRPLNQYLEYNTVSSRRRVWQNTQGWRMKGRLFQFHWECAKGATEPVTFELIDKPAVSR